MLTDSDVLCIQKQRQDVDSFCFMRKYLKWVHTSEMGDERFNFNRSYPVWTFSYILWSPDDLSKKLNWCQEIGRTPWALNTWFFYYIRLPSVERREDMEVWLAYVGSEKQFFPCPSKFWLDGEIHVRQIPGESGCMCTYRVSTMWPWDTFCNGGLYVTLH